MIKNYLLIGFLVLLFLAGSAFVLLLVGFGKYKGLPRVCFQETCFYVEVADSPAARERGLMFRKYLAEDRGMLFVFGKEDVYSFWMKNTLIPLDIIWINKDGEVVFIKNNSQPCREEICPGINPHQRAQYVLELNAGTAERINLNIGDRLVFMLG